jgi:hypothetical protein
MYRRMITAHGHSGLRACVIPLALAMAIWSVPAASAQRLVSIQPTVLLTREKDALLQIAQVVVENTAEPVEAAQEERKPRQDHGVLPRRAGECIRPDAQTGGGRQRPYHPADRNGGPGGNGHRDVASLGGWECLSHQPGC